MKMSQLAKVAIEEMRKVLVSVRFNWNQYILTYVRQQSIIEF